MGLLTYVVPQVVQVFEQTRQPLPLLTRVMLSITAALHANAGFILVVLIALPFAARMAYRKDGMRAKWHSTVLRLPLVGSLVQGIESAQLASTLSILVGSGVPILQALNAGANVLYSVPLRRAVMEATERVREGSAVHR